jgi:hypothetical protein
MERGNESLHWTDAGFLGILWSLTVTEKFLCGTQEIHTKSSWKEATWEDNIKMDMRKDCKNLNCIMIWSSGFETVDSNTIVGWLIELQEHCCVRLEVWDPGIFLKEKVIHNTNLFFFFFLNLLWGNASVERWWWLNKQGPLSFPSKCVVHLMALFHLLFGYSVGIAAQHCIPLQMYFNYDWCCKDSWVTQLVMLGSYVTPP